MQIRPGDCAIAALAMLLGVPYRQVSNAALKIHKKIHTRGMRTKEMERVAKALGVTLAGREIAEIDDETGLLLLYRGRSDAHVVLLFRGVVYDPADGCLWDPDAYCTTRNWKIAGLLEVR